MNSRSTVEPYTKLGIKDTIILVQREGHCVIDLDKYLSLNHTRSSQSHQLDTLKELKSVLISRLLYQIIHSYECTCSTNTGTTTDFTAGFIMPN